MQCHAKSLQSYPTLCNPTDCSPPGSSVHGIRQAKILQWVAMPFSRGSASFFTACKLRMVTQRWPKFQFQYAQMKFYCIPTVFVHLPAMSGCFCTRAGKSNRYSRGPMACRAPNTCCLVLYETICWSLPWKVLNTKKKKKKKKQRVGWNLPRWSSTSQYLQKYFPTSPFLLGDNWLKKKIVLNFYLFQKGLISFSQT